MQSNLPSESVTSPGTAFYMACLMRPSGENPRRQMAAIRCLLARFPESKRSVLCNRLAARLTPHSSFKETYDAIVLTMGELELL